MSSCKARKAKSKNWWIRHQNDPYVKAAHKIGYRSRASFKLLEIQKRFEILKEDSVVLDFGCSPGGWSEVAGAIVGKRGLVIGIDRAPMKPIPEVIQIVCDLTDHNLPQKLQTHLQKRTVDCIISDIAPDTTGHKKVDRLRMEQMVEEVWSLIAEFLAKDGHFVMKIRDGTLPNTLQRHIGQHTNSLRIFKPDASRNASSETYLVGKGFLPQVAAL